MSESTYGAHVSGECAISVSKFFRRIVFFSQRKGNFNHSVSLGGTAKKPLLSNRDQALITSRKLKEDLCRAGSYLITA